ncbi:MAG: glycosyltransferase family 4 protein [Planctomycetota bacterium]
MSKIKVLEVLEATTAGTAKHLITLLKGVDRSRFEVEVAAPLVRTKWADKGDTRFVEKVKALGFRIHAVDLRSGVNPIADSRGLLALFRLIRRGRYDVVHLHSSKAGFLGRIAAKLNRIKTVYTPNGLYFLNPRRAMARRFFLFLEQFGGVLTDRMIAVSDSERRQIVDHRTVREARVSVIPNALDCDDGFAPDLSARDRIRRELGIPDDVLVLGTASRYCRQKDPHTLIRAAKIMLQRTDKVRFVWCGEGEQRTETEQFAREHGVGEAFHFLGFRHDIQAVMNAFDIFVLSSIYEGLPYVLLEAMLLELPVVATDVTGNRDIVKTDTGLLVPPQQPQALAEAMLALAEDPARRDAMGKRGAEVVRECYSMPDMVRATQQVYEALARPDP